MDSARFQDKDQPDIKL